MRIVSPQEPVLFYLLAPVQVACLILFIGALLCVHVLIGGTRLVFSLPGYGVLAVVGLLSPFLHRKSLVTPNIVCWIATAVFFVYILLRSFFSAVPYLARFDLYLALASLIVYIITARYFVVPKFRWAVLIALMGVALINVFWGLLQYVRGGDVALFEFLQPADYGWRASGFFICPNHLAGFMEFIAIMSWSMVFWSRRQLWLKIVGGYTGAAAIAAILMTGSRGGYLSLFVGLCVFATLSLLALYRSSNEKFNVALCGTILLGALAMVVIVGFVSQDVALRFRTVDIQGSTFTRWHLWEAAAQQFQQAPLVGTGAGTYLYYGRQFRNPEVQGDPGHVHNDYLELLAEYGLVGGVLFLAMVAVHVWTGGRVLFWFVTTRGSRLRRLRSDALALNIGGLSVLASIATHSLIDFNMHIPANALVAAFILGMLANPGALVPFNEKDVPRFSRVMKWAGPAAGLWLLALALPTLPAEIYAERARTAYRDRQFAEAISFAEKGRAFDARNPYLWLYQGQSYTELAYAAGEENGGTRLAWENAAQAYEQGLKHYPMDKWLLLGMGEALDELGRHNEARPYFERAVHWDPNSAPVRFLYGRHLHQAGRFDEAEREYNTSVRIHPNHAARLGLSHLNRDRQAQTGP